MKNILIWVLIILAVGLGVWYFFLGGSGRIADSNAVAIVNGEEISNREVSELEDQIAQGQGFALSDLDEETRDELRAQAVDSLVSQALLRQAVDSSDVAVSENEVDAQITLIKSQFDGEAAYQSALASEGLSEEALRVQLNSDLAVQNYLEAELALSSVSVTEGEINAAYEEATAAQELPPLEEVRDQLEQTLIQQKQQALISEHVAELRAEADIEILI